MTENNAAGDRSLIDRLVPRAGVRVQLVAAALVWLVGSSILIFRGVGYVHDRYWHAWALAAALVIGVLKSRYLLDRVAGKAIARIRARGRACFFGFFSWRSWLLVGLMMGGGIMLRHLVVHPGIIGAGIMGALYLGIGSALLIADRLFWQAVASEFRPSTEPEVRPGPVSATVAEVSTPAEPPAA
jgi:hypothetical protein